MTAGTLSMHKERDLVLRSVKIAVKTEVCRPDSAISLRQRHACTRDPLSSSSKAHNRSTNTVISRVSLHGHLAESIGMSLRQRNVLCTHWTHSQCERNQLPSRTHWDGSYTPQELRRNALFAPGRRAIFFL